MFTRSAYSVFRAVPSSAFRVTTPAATQFQQQRTAVSLKELKGRMTTINTIRKITSSMNKLATSRLTAARAKNDNIAQPFLAINMAFLKGKGMEEYLHKDHIDLEEKEVIFIVTTDRGMCGSTNSGITRAFKNLMLQNRKSDVDVVILGGKGASTLRRDFANKFHTNVAELGKKQLAFVDVEPAVQVLDEVTTYDKVRIISNQWESVVSFNIIHRLLPNPENMVDEMKESYYGYEYDGSDEGELFKNLQEHLASCILYGSLIENAAVELAARMNSMDNATNNAADMYRTLSSLYNRTRQAGITTELSEIIAGAASVTEADA